VHRTLAGTLVAVAMIASIARAATPQGAATKQRLRLSVVPISATTTDANSMRLLATLHNDSKVPATITELPEGVILIASMRRNGKRVEPISEPTMRYQSLLSSQRQEERTLEPGAQHTFVLYPSDGSWFSDTHEDQRETYPFREPGEYRLVLFY